MTKAAKIIDRDAQIIYRNFSGRESEFNPSGSRNFCLVISPEIVDELSAQGWNIKQTTPQEDGDAPLYFVKANIKFGIRPPRIWTVSSGGKTLLEESDLSQLDALRFEKVMLTINPYEYKPGHLSGYVDEMYIEIEPSEFEAEYGGLPNNTHA